MNTLQISNRLYKGCNAFITVICRLLFNHSDIKWLLRSSLRAVSQNRMQANIIESLLMIMMRMNKIGLCVNMNAHVLYIHNIFPLRSKGHITQKINK